MANDAPQSAETLQPTRDLSLSAEDWLRLAHERVTDNPALETMKSLSIVVNYPIDRVWQAIGTVKHWEADAFHNALIDPPEGGHVGSFFEMIHTNHPIIPWPMKDQRFVGVITDWVTNERQVLAELNISDAEGSKRTPNHQQTIELSSQGGERTEIRLTVATIRMAGISSTVRFFFRPWARFQLGRAIRKKFGHINADLKTA